MPNPTLKNVYAMKTLGISVAVFLVLYEALQVLIRVIGPFRIPDSPEYVAVMVLAITPYLIAGYVAASEGRKRGLVNCIILGIISAVFLEIDCIVRIPSLLHACGAGNIIYYLVQGIVLAGIGGLTWNLKEAIRRRRAKSLTP